MNDNVLTALIVEDEPESLQLLEGLIKSDGNARVTATTRNPFEAVDLIKSHNPDIVFLDVKMPGKNGFEILDEIINMQSYNPFIIFTTAHDEYALKAFEYAAFDYLLKPVEPDRLASTLQRCRETRSPMTIQKSKALHDFHKRLAFRNISGLVIIDPDDVLYLEAEGNYSVIKLRGNKSEIVTMQLGKISEEMLSDRFFRISRSHIINLNYLKKINSVRKVCLLQDESAETSLKISRDRMKILLNQLRYS